MKVSDVPQAPSAFVEIIGDLSVTLNLNVNIIQDVKGGCFITLIILCNILRRKIPTDFTYVYMKKNYTLKHGYL